MSALYTQKVINVDSEDRNYVLHVPANVLATPDLVISCHGGGSNGIEWWERHWHRQANKGFIIVCPTASPSTSSNWVALGDKRHEPMIDEHRDEKFLSAMIDELVANHKVNRIYMCGFSSGAKMTHHMYTYRRDIIDSFGMSGQGIRIPMADILLQKTPVDHPRAVRISIGTKDDNYIDPNEDTLDAMDTMLAYKDMLEAHGLPHKAVFKGSRTTAKTLTWGDGAAPLQMVQISGMQHRWPKVTKGDPFYEDDALIEFWRKHGNMQ